MELLSRSTRPAHYPPMKSREAKAAYRKYGPRLTIEEQRRLDRGAELQARAEKIRENEKKRKVNLKKRLEKEEKQRETRKKLGTPTHKTLLGADQPSLSQFVSVIKHVREANQKKKDPWDDDELDEPLLLNAFNASLNEPATHPNLEKKTTDANVIKRKLSASPPPEALEDFISTQDIKLSEEELRELGSASPTTSDQCQSKGDTQSKLTNQEERFERSQHHFSESSGDLKIVSVAQSFLSDDFQISTQDRQEIG